MSARITAAAWMVSLVGCDGGRYEIVVHVPGDPTRAATVEVSVLRSCDEISADGNEPASPIRTVLVTAGRGEPIGWLSQGSYCLYGRAWDDDCLMYAAGRSPARIDDGGSGTLNLELSPIPPRGCDSGERCEQGRCATLDDGGGSGSDASPDGGVDAGVDAGSDAGADGGGCGVPVPRVVGSVETSDEALRVAVSGAAAVVMVRTGFDLVDVTDPGAPSVAWSWTADGESPHGAAISGQYAYVSFAWDLTVYDISIPAAPVRLETAVTSWGAEGIELRDGWAYAAGGPYLEVFDVANPGAPTMVGSASTSGIAQAIAVSEIWESMVFVAALDAGFLVADVQSPEEPGLTGTYETTDATDVISWGSWALVADRGEGLLVLDPGMDPRNPPLAASLPIDGARSVAAAGTWGAERGYVVVADGAELHVVDMSDPRQPELATAVSVPGATDVAVSLPNAFVAAGNDGLQVVDLCLPP